MSRTALPLMGLALLLAAGPSWGERASRFEAGGGVTAFTFPNYAGASGERTLVLPFPYFRYTSKRLRVGDGGAQTRLDLRLRLGVSGGGSLPGGNDQPPRDGMPRLLPSAELGPSLDWRLGDLGRAQERWQLRLPLRAILATDLRESEFIGYTFAPSLSYGRAVGRPERRGVLVVSAGSRFATGRHHDYFYGVDPAFAREGRPAFDAPGGYGGSSLSLAFSEGTGRWRWGAFARYGYLGGAAFVDSPLVETRSVVSGGVFLSFRLYQTRPPRSLGDEEVLFE